MEFGTWSSFHPLDELAKIKIGTCAWSFEDWRGVFYPPHLPANRWLEFYARHFNAVEVDSTFYHTPAPHVATHWFEVTPPDFTFTCKLPREITHDRKLRESGELVRHFLESITPLRPKLGCVLIQLPPYFSVKHDESALREFVRALPAEWPFAIEFRKSEWHLPRAAHFLEEHRIGWVWSDLTSLDRQAEGAFGFLPETVDFAYVRLMGDLEKKYDDGGRKIHRYRELLWPREPGLESWGVRIRQAAETKAEIFVAVSNHYEGFAPQSCQRLAGRLGRTVELPVTGEESAVPDPQMPLL